MDHKAYKISDVGDFGRLTEGLKLAQCMRCDTAPDLPSEGDGLLRGLEDLSVSDKLYCSYCKCGFEDQTQQRQHYKLDWHRYNLKQSLLDKKPVTEENFSTLADDDDVSSISGSESDSESDSELDSTEVATGGSGSETDVKRKRANVLLAWRHSKVFFENGSGKILSVYRCLMHGKKDAPEKDDDYVKLALQTVDRTKWAILMLGGGHFAGGIFNGQEVVAHKTFHCYTVRKGQGGSQSSKDSRSGGSHPKSAGASLRRYNEAALVQHVQDLMSTWAADLVACDLVFYRAAGHNTAVLFGGRNPPLAKTDARLRTVPFPTRRATFSEVKRVRDVLATVEVYGAAVDYEISFPQSPRKKVIKRDSVQTPESSSADILNPFVSLSTTEDSAETNNRSPKQRMDRAKSREVTERPLPNIVNELAVSSSESENESGGESFMVHDDFETNFTRDLLEHEDTVPQHMKNRRKKKRFPKVKKAKVEEEVIVERAEIVELRKRLVAACTAGDVVLLALTLKTVCDSSTKFEEKGMQPAATSVMEGNVNMEENSTSHLTSDDLLACLNEQIDEKGNRLLHVAAGNGQTDITRLLMESGSDPSIKNKSNQPPYVVSANKETRNAFRRFVAEFPDKYDYTKTQIPGGLTDELEKEQAEKRRALKKAKREKGREKKKEEDEKKEEMAEKERFLKLTDREKRALAAERRIVSSAVHGGVTAPVVARCFLCAVDISGKVPFQYDINRFCSIDCLKAHRMSNKTKL